MQAISFLLEEVGLNKRGRLNLTHCLYNLATRVKGLPHPIATETGTVSLSMGTAVAEADRTRLATYIRQIAEVHIWVTLNIHSGLGDIR
jgi:hypothetical protein